MPGAIEIRDVRLFRPTAPGPGPPERYVLEVFLENRAGGPVKDYSIEVLDGKQVVGVSARTVPSLPPEAGRPQPVAVTLDGLPGYGRGGWEDPPGWLREGKDLDVRIRTSERFPIFLSWLRLPRASDRKVFHLQFPGRGEALR